MKYIMYVEFTTTFKIGYRFSWYYDLKKPWLRNIYECDEVCD